MSASIILSDYLTTVTRLNPSSTAGGTSFAAIARIGFFGHHARAAAVAFQADLERHVEKQRFDSAAVPLCAIFT